MNVPPTENPAARCSACGKWGAVEFDGVALCDDCVDDCGSSCAGGPDEDPAN